MNGSVIGKYLFGVVLANNVKTPTCKEAAVSMQEMS